MLFQKLQRTSLESTLPNDLTVGGSKAVLSSLMTFFPLTELSDNPNVLQHRMGDFVTKKQSVQVNIVTVVTLISLNLPSGDFTQFLTTKVRIVADVADDHKTPRAEINC